MKWVKKWLKVFSGNVRAFFSHPVLYGKAFCKDFMQQDLKGKIKKVALLLLGAYLCYEILMFVLAVIFVSALVGGTGYDVLKGRFIDRFGREPENDYELYHDYQDFY